MYKESDLPKELKTLLECSYSFKLPIESQVLWNDSITTLEMNLREHISKEKDRKFKAGIHKNVQDYIKYFSTSTSFRNPSALASSAQTATPLPAARPSNFRTVG